MVCAARAIRYAIELEIFENKDSEDAIIANKLVESLTDRQLTDVDRYHASDIWECLIMLPPQQQKKITRVIGECYGAIDE